MKDWEKYALGFNQQKERDEIYARIENMYRDSVKFFISETINLIGSKSLLEENF